MMYKIMKTIARIASRNVHAMNEKLMKLLISYSRQIQESEHSIFNIIES